MLTILVRGGCSAAVVLRIHTTDPLQGSPPSVIALAGEWDGIYTKRHRAKWIVWFKLIAGEDHAHGDVLMTPRGRMEPYYRYPPSGWPCSWTARSPHARPDNSVRARIRWHGRRPSRAVLASRPPVRADHHLRFFDDASGPLQHILLLPKCEKLIHRLRIYPLDSQTAVRSGYQEVDRCGLVFSDQFVPW